MRVLQDAVILEELGEPQSTVEYFSSPHGASGAHEVDLLQPVVRWLEVPVDRISRLIVVAARLVRLKETQPAIPAPTARSARVEVLVGNVPGDPTGRLQLVRAECRDEPREELRIQADVVVDEGDELPPCS